MTALRCPRCSLRVGPQGCGCGMYPAHWKEFSREIRFGRAAGRCECIGECGLHRTHPGPRRCIERDRKAARWARGRVILTVAHLCDCNPLCANPDHVKAMCNRCHLRVDAELHRKRAAAGRMHQREIAGQEVLL